MDAAIFQKILRIYDTVADPTLWPEVLDEIARDVSAVGCIVFEWHDEPRQLGTTYASAYYDPAVLQGYIDRCGEDETRDQDVFERHSLRQDSIDLIDDDVLAPTPADLKELPNVQKLRMFGILHRAAGLLNKDNTRVSRFSIQLGESRGPLAPSERAHLDKVLPHVAKALDLSYPAKRLKSEHQTLLAAMDRLVIGLCILDRHGRLVQENEEFRRQRDTYKTFAITPSGGFCLAQPAEQRRLAELTEHVQNHGWFGARPRKEAIATTQDGFLCLDVAPLYRSDEIGSSVFDGFVIYSTDTSLPPRCNIHPMKDAYGLTETEFELLDEISKGLTNSQIASQRERAISTINAQVKSILSKTQCHTRTQLVRLMMSFGTEFLKNPAV